MFRRIQPVKERITSGNNSQGRKRVRRHRSVLSGSSLALIGNASAHEGRGEDLYPSRGVFDKETRRKPLAFAADAGYGN
jgi:hypothetical protein